MRRFTITVERVRRLVRGHNLVLLVLVVLAAAGSGLWFHLRWGTGPAEPMCLVMTRQDVRPLVGEAVSVSDDRGGPIPSPEPGYWTCSVHGDFRRRGRHCPSWRPGSPAQTPRPPAAGRHWFHSAQSAAEPRHDRCADPCGLAHRHRDHDPASVETPARSQEKIVVECTRARRTNHERPGSRLPGLVE